MKYALTLLAPAMAAAVSLKSLLGESEITHEMYQSGRVHEAAMNYKMVLLHVPRYVMARN
jgi:hypothetical protein